MCGEGIPVIGSSMCKGPGVGRRVGAIRSLNTGPLAQV